jgi:hypothetical protein
LETSALQSINIEKAFQQMIEDIYNKNHKNFQEEDEDLEMEFPQGQVVDLNNKSNKDDKKCC